ncbi:hypothetical protein Syun_023684 [Stephania yunnanensis]|uniref:J domain-containing protein n=1 Tax=Stephania yunnanensis TaxID=152371 RepID=A0AAP0FHN1_9MAGN
MSSERMLSKQEHVRQNDKRRSGDKGKKVKLLQMVDYGQAVDIRGISDRVLVKQLKKLFASLRLKSSVTGVYLLPSKAHPTLEVVVPVISTYLASQEQQDVHSVAPNREQPMPSNAQCGKIMNELDEGKSVELSETDDLPASRRRLIGPEMPSFELAAAAKLTKVEAALREAEVETDADLFIGPPPALVAEAESANKAERFEEITRILGVEIENPYDVLGANWKTSSDNIKKRYWKLSLMVHPDKCSHPQAHQAFVALNKAFKDIQDPDKRKALDDQIQKKEEQEEMKAELRAMREAAQLYINGGDKELLAEPELPPKREEWMTTLPPERKGWKSGSSYLEAYNEAAALADSAEKKRTNSDAALFDQYNSVKSSKTLMQKHHEERSSKRKAKKEEKKKDEWEGQHPWKPWDREKDLTAGRLKVNLDLESMVQGLSSRFSSGNIQKNFLRYRCPRDSDRHVDPRGGLQSDSAFSEGAIGYWSVHVDPRGLQQPTHWGALIAPSQKALSAHHVIVFPKPTQRISASVSVGMQGKGRSGRDAGGGERTRSRGAGRSATEVRREEVAADQRRSGAAAGERGAAAAGHQSSQRRRRRRSREGGGGMYGRKN